MVETPNRSTYRILVSGHFQRWQWACGVEESKRYDSHGNSYCLWIPWVYYRKEDTMFPSIANVPSDVPQELRQNVIYIEEHFSNFLGRTDDE